MKRLFLIEPWKVVENELHKEDFRLAESMTSLGNGHMGMRGNFEETFSGDTHQGTYVAGVYYPDKTRVGWWKNGYPEYFAKVLNAPNYIGIRVWLNEVEVDLAKANVTNFRRELNMKHGYLVREFTITDENGRETSVKVTRFLSVVHREVAAIQYSVTPVNHDCTVTFEPFIDGDVRNEDSNYDEDFWKTLTNEATAEQATISMQTRKTHFDVAVSMMNAFEGATFTNTVVKNEEEFVSSTWTANVATGTTVSIYKYVAVTTSRDYDREEIIDMAKQRVEAAKQMGFTTLLQEQQTAWEKRWEDADVIIEGDDEAQQGIRFNIFQLFSTYFGEDPRLNIGPKGFTGEKYGGSTYWDTEAYCLPMYLATTDTEVSRNLLVYRYNHLDNAKVNAGRQGLDGALYPMVTMDGLESHNEWEITFEEIHRNGAIAYAIYNYCNYTGDWDYVGEYGFEVLAEISRFWADRVHFHAKKKVYMMHGVTGPNEYENNINNNWYTNVLAAWTLEFTMQMGKMVKEKSPERYEELVSKLGLQHSELEKWADIQEKMYLPYDEELDVFVQHDGFLDKELMPVSALSQEHLPLNQNWSWDRILRSCFIKQADVLQGIYLFGDRFTTEQKQKNFDFYEPMTVHESSLSPCIYSIIAAEVGYEKKAHELYLRTARLDLDNYNNDTEDGLHITSMSGSWLAIVQGFASMRTWNEELSFAPFLPEAWNGYTFKIVYRGHHLAIAVSKDEVTISQVGGTELSLKLYGETVVVPANGEVKTVTKQMV